jgi:hypothetical protein
MTSPVQDGGRRALQALAICAVAFTSSVAHGGGPGANRGFVGFGLSYHLGYGYGGRGLGVGAEGGYPYYSGPGYPHEPPPLRRLGKIAPFTYYGGPGYPCNGPSHFFEGVGPLVIDPPLVISGMDRPDLPVASDYGPFSGVIR